MASQPEAPAEEAKKGGKKKLILILVAAAVLLVGGGAGAFVLMSGKGKAPALNEKGAEANAEGKEKNAGKGEGKDGEEASSTFKFEMPFLITLADQKQHKVLQLFVSVDLSDPSYANILKREQDKFRDAVYTEVSRRTRNDVASLEGKERLKRDLAKIFDGLLGKPGAVKGIYFPDYVLPL
ncbi:MAG: flagellar basal body-associated FliL family protein [Candidatus Sumerlaeota bacterium]|nr:flagellar basal body-associated FliL family protein [Candidatus Sumerlaeota bacterium]